nr:hypothetical protein [Priestia koreensis]
MTLVELLATFAIASIILVILYSVFANGIKVSKKVEADAELRDEGDYVVTTIMNKMAESPVDRIKKCYPDQTQITCFKVYHDKELALKGYSNDSNTNTFYDVQKTSKPKASVIEFELIEQEKNKSIISISTYTEIKNQDGTFTIEDKKTNPIEIENNLAGSTLAFKCSPNNVTDNCKSALIDLNLTITSTSKMATSGLSNDNGPLSLTLKSQFGF